MNKRHLKKWIQKQEKENKIQSMPDDMRIRVYKNALGRIRSINYLQMSSQKENPKKMPKKIVKAAFISLAVLSFASLSTLTYAAVSGQLFGIFVATPELESQLNQPPQTGTVEILDEGETPSPPELSSNRFQSKIADENTFDTPEFYLWVSDFELHPTQNGWQASEFIFNYQNLAVLTKEDDTGWLLEEGQEIAITVAIDTDYAGCDEQGEYLEFGYIFNGKYTFFDTQKISNEKSTYTFTAPEKGEYYPTIMNATVTYVKVNFLEIHQ